MLFALSASLLAQKRACSTSEWKILLFDKRTDYKRTHRLRIDPEPLRNLQKDLDHVLFDELMQRLDDSEFSPAVNDLEHWLSLAVGQVGIERELLTIGSDERLGETSIAQLRALIIARGDLTLEGLLTVVGADSVHSAVREIVGGDGSLTSKSHQNVARIRVVGSDLPRSISTFEKLRLSKALASAADYRLNRNGFAEVDLLLDVSTVGRIETLGATPATPIPITRETLLTIGSPFVSRVIQHFRDDIGNGDNEISLQSTFRLEHQFVNTAVYVDVLARQDESTHTDQMVDSDTFPDNRGVTTVFLVGDAATSLPFFRGMACLTATVHQLALAHIQIADVVQSTPAADAPTTRRIVEIGDLFNVEARSIRSREVDTVNQRARAVRAARELGRVSAMLPFPIQVMVLSLDRRRLRGPLARRLPRREDCFNALLALVAGLLVIPRMVSATQMFWFPWIWGVGLQVLGGASYRASEQFALLRSWARIIWFMQIALLTTFGVAFAVFVSVGAGAPRHVVAAVTWLIMGFAFVPGIYLFEHMRRISDRRNPDGPD